jgi:hypothetical protein
MNIRSGRKTVATAGTAEPLMATNTPVSKVYITPETDNTNPVTVGGADVVGALATRKGVPLDNDATTEQVLVLCDVDLKDVYIDAVTNGEGVTFTYIF